ncbi:hypothetical protein PoB_007492600 [Plakobranchus ocellatus]|uniref:Uncharacterized protein n=1 Tax=Plakobranchus ocellatus TaxID=259542 RepID=A0AAV4DX67_9GAST|nr:hypothetical protein PoB_007492600 [Plakobranchus ocellatus]
MVNLSVASNSTNRTKWVARSLKDPATIKMARKAMTNTPECRMPKTIRTLLLIPRRLDQAWNSNLISQLVQGQ